MLKAYEKYGVDPVDALAEAQITPDELAQEDARITAAQMEAFSRRAMQELDDEALGSFGRRLPWGSYGMLVRASLTSPHLQLALSRWCRHHALLTDDIVFHLEVQRDLATVHIEERVDLGGLREFALLTSLRNVHAVASWLSDARLPLREVVFPFAAPAHADVYPLLFPGPVHFGSARAGFSFDARHLALPLKRDERALQAMLQRAVRLIVLPYRRERLLAPRVRELLRSDPARLGSAERLAQALNLSPRSLHRHLQAEGVELQALKDEVRRDIAIDQLRRTTRPVKQVAQAAGFDNEKSFARAFRAWTGLTPSGFRQAHGGAGE